MKPHSLKLRAATSLSCLAASALLLLSVSQAKAEEKIENIPAFGKFHHAGVPTTVKHENETYVSAGDVFMTDPSESPAGIAWLRWGSNSDAPAKLREQPYLAFQVKDINAVLWKYNVLVQPMSVTNDMRIAFILDHDVVIGLVEDKNVASKRFGAFHHVGVPSKVKAKDEQYISVGDVYMTDPMKSAARISMLRWGAYSEAPEKLQKLPYIAFTVKDLDKSLIDKTTIVEPVATPQGWRMAFIDYMGLPVGLIEE